MKKKKIYLDRKKDKYCWVQLYKTKEEMIKDYKKLAPEDKKLDGVLGVNLAWTIFKTKGRKMIYTPETGKVLLCLDHCEAGIVSHEFMHAVLWANKHSTKKKQYPIVIRSMKDEERLLYNLTYAVRQFYTWYWKVKDIVY